MLKYNKNRFIINTIKEEHNYISDINELNIIINNMIILLQQKNINNKFTNKFTNNLLNQIDLISNNLKNNLDNNLNNI